MSEEQAQWLQPRRLGTFAAVALVALVFDVVTKIVAAARLEDREPVPVLGGTAYLQVVRNPGAAFSLASDFTWLLSVIAIVVSLVIVGFAMRLRSRAWAVGFGLVLAGALGNLVDRIFRAPGPMQGHVVDFVSLFAPDGRFWPIFNVADAAIVTGAALLILLTLLGRDYDGSTPATARAENRREQ